MQSVLARLATIITDLSLFTPTNLTAEKELFFAQEGYNPQFTYKNTDFPIKAFRKDLEQYLQQTQSADARINELVQERVRELFLWLDLHDAKGTDDFSTIAVKLYGKPSHRLLQAANDFLGQSQREETPQRTLGPEAIVAPLQQAIKERGLDLDVVIVDGLATRIHYVRGKELRINKDATFAPEDIEKLIIHEVQTHAVRYQNGLSQDDDIFATGTAHFLETEEGLATYNEDEAGVLPSRVKRNHAARVLAVNKALHASFRETYDLIEPFVGSEKAFEICVQVKRGLADTSKPGAFTKSYVYFSGWQKIRALPPEDLPYLYVGKVSYVHLPIIKQLVQEGKVRLPK